jgi:hypothetical protein
VPGRVVRLPITQGRPRPADTDSHAIPFWRRFSPSQVARSDEAGQAPWVGRAEPWDAPCLCLPVGSAIVVFGEASMGGRRDCGRVDVTEQAGGVAEGWRASRCGRLLTAGPRPAPVLSPAPPRRGWVGRRRFARPPGGAGPPLRAGSLWLLFHVEPRQFGGAGAPPSATPPQYRGWVAGCPGASEARARAGPRHVPRGTSGGLPAPRAGRPPCKWRRGPVERP